MAKEKKKKDDWDPGITIAPMNGDELPKFRRMAYLNRAKRPSKEERQKLKNMYTKKEKRAIIRGGFLSMLPMFLVCIIGFGVTIAIIYLWLR
ncbi:MAG: hypothetical protein K2M36_05920 [Clostridia bacterium]|nr:hypothetical protein [Clostridia bacterium]